eukprot:543356_1
MALALSEVKDEQKYAWNVDTYNEASKKLFKAAQEDLEDFTIDDQPIIHVKHSILKFPNVTCPQIILTFYAESQVYDKYPLKLEITYQYKSVLMVSKDKNIEFLTEPNNEIRLRPRIKGIIRHFNFSDEGLLSGYQHGLNVLKKFDSLKNVFLAVQDIISNPIIPITTMYPIKKLENAWKNHQDDSCPCAFYNAMPCSWNIYSNSTYTLREKYVSELRNSLKQQHLQDYYTQQNKLNSNIKKYKPIFPYLWSDHWNYKRILDVQLLKIFHDKQNGKKIFVEKFVKTEIKNRVFSFPFFNSTFCDELVKELRNFENTPYLSKDRPNSMNNYGVILNNIGLEPFVTDLFDKYLTTIANWIFPSNVKKNDIELTDEDLDFTYNGSLDHHHTFMVQYKTDADLFLDMHIDDSEVTFNINIFDEFTGAELAICGLTGEKTRRSHLLSYNHKKGRCLVHAGRQRHGARSITGGERQNLVIWCRSSWERVINPHGSGRCACCKYAKKYKDQNDPDPICLSKTHDKDYDKWVDTYSNEYFYGNKKNNFTIENEMDDKEAREARDDDILIEDNDDEGKQNDNPLL